MFFSYFSSVLAGASQLVRVEKLFYDELFFMGTAVSLACNSTVTLFFFSEKEASGGARGGRGFRRGIFNRIAQKNTLCSSI